MVEGLAANSERALQVTRKLYELVWISSCHITGMKVIRAAHLFLLFRRLHEQSTGGRCNVCMVIVDDTIHLRACDVQQCLAAI